MSFGGLGLSLSHRLRQRHKKQCERCGLYFDKQLSRCTHCSELDDDELAKLIARRETEHEVRSDLGIKFFIAAVILLVVIFVFAS